MAKRLVFPSAGRVACESFDEPAVGPDKVRVKTLFSLISTGTETIVFNRVFDPGTHWDNWVKYPFYPGYAAVGEIAEIGSDVSDYKIGDRVAMRSGHASGHVLSSSACLPVPKNIEPKDAVWFALAKIAAMAARKAEYRLGDSVLMIGAGPIGQMALRWANTAGATTIIVNDRVEKRLEIAKRGGATHVIAKPIAEAMDDIIAATSGKRPRVVVDITGHPEVFEYALKAADQYGRVVLLGDTGHPAQQHLTPDVISKGLTIIGVHDSHEDEIWNSEIIVKTFFDLVGSGRFSLDGLNTHVLNPENCVDAYELASNKRDETMGMLFDWTK